MPLFYYSSTSHQSHPRPLPTQDLRDMGAVQIGSSLIVGVLLSAIFITWLNKLSGDLKPYYSRCDSGGKYIY